MLACSGSVSGRMERSALLEGTTQQNFSSLFAQAKRKGKTEVGGTAARAIRAAKCSRVESLTGRHYITLLGLSQMTLEKKISSITAVSSIQEASWAACNIHKKTALMPVLTRPSSVVSPRASRGSKPCLPTTPLQSSLVRGTSRREIGRWEQAVESLSCQSLTYALNASTRW